MSKTRDETSAATHIVPSTGSGQAQSRVAISNERLATVDAVQVRFRSMGRTAGIVTVFRPGHLLALALDTS